jgi:hypothetical protein
MAPNYREDSKNPRRNVPLRAVHLGHRPWDLLHADLVGRDQRLSLARRRRPRRPEQLGRLLLHRGAPLCRAVPEGPPELVHNHRLVRVRNGVPQHHGALQRTSITGGRRSPPRSWPPSARFTCCTWRSRTSTSSARDTARSPRTMACNRPTIVYRLVFGDATDHPKGAIADAHIRRTRPWRRRGADP